jgi:hypothetical protein
MTALAERELYPEVAEWLVRHLQGKYRRASVEAHDTHRSLLSSFLLSQGLHKHFRDCQAYEIQVDVTGIVRTRTQVRLAFVECKVAPITLRDVGQLLGYSLVARPEWSYLLSPAGFSEKLRTLLLTFGRLDILAYGKDRTIRLAEWNPSRREINLASLLPRGGHS